MGTEQPTLSGNAPGSEFLTDGVAMLPRLLLVAGLTIGVMVPLIWAAIAPEPALRDVAERESDPTHSEAGAASHEAPTSESALPPTSSARSIETTIGTAPDGQQSAPTSPSVDLHGERTLKPSLAKPSPSQAYKEAEPAPVASEDVKPLSAQAVTPAVSVTPQPETPREDKPPPQAYKEAEPAPVASEEAQPLSAQTGNPEVSVTPQLATPREAKPLSQAYNKEAEPARVASEEAKPLPGKVGTPAVSVTPQLKTPRKAKPQHAAPDASRNDRARASLSGVRSSKMVDRARLRDRADWIDIMRDTGWLGRGRRH